MKIRLVYIVTNPITARILLRGQLSYMRRHGFEVFVISAPGPDLDDVALKEEVETIPIPYEREISLASDMINLFRTYRILKRLQPHIVNASTPKAGMIGMLAAWLTNVPVRIYLLRGLRMQTTRGVKRWILKLTERIAATCANRVVAVSHSLKSAYLEQELTTPEKISVLLSGSSNGIDLERFRSEKAGSIRAEVRERLGIAPTAPVVGFVGRLTRDKGIPELLVAFEQLLQHLPESRLLIVGQTEPGDPLPAELMEKMQTHKAIVQTGQSLHAENFYAALDVLAFPSRREGFPNAPLEAAAFGIPAVGFHVTGTVDAIIDGVTGKIVPAGDVQAFSDALYEYLSQPKTRKTHGQAAERRVREKFASIEIWKAFATEYRRLLTSNVRYSNVLEIIS